MAQITNDGSATDEKITQNDERPIAEKYGTLIDWTWQCARCNDDSVIDATMVVWLMQQSTSDQWNDIDGTMALGLMQQSQ